MTKVNLNNEPNEIITGNDNIVIAKYLDGIDGGRSLDVTGYPLTVIKAGVPAITDGTGTYKPMPMNEDKTAFGTLPDGYSYAGIIRGTIRVAKPFAAIMTRGRVNMAAAPYAYDTILTALKVALPLVEFRKDEEA